MEGYLSAYGWHFNKKMCDFAVSLMRRVSGTKTEKVEPMSKETVDQILRTYGVELDNAVLYDYVFVANRCRATLLGKSVADEMKLAFYVKDVIDDINAGDGDEFVSWYAKMAHNGQPIDWDEMV